MEFVSLRYENLSELQQVFGYDPVRAAVQSAIGKTAKKARTLISKEVRKTYNIKARDIAQVVSILPQGADRVLLWKGGRLPLDYFAPKFGMVKVDVNRGGRVHRAKRRQVSVRVRKDRGRQISKHAFWGSGKNSGKQLVFQREDQSDNKSDIEMKEGPAIPHMVAKVGDRAVSDFVRQDFESQFMHEMDRQIRKLMSSGG